MAQEHHILPLRVYFTIFFALLGLTALTVWAAFQDFGLFNNLVAMSIAVLKGTLVVLYFMHVRYSSRLVWLFAGAGFFWLIFLFGITMTDYISRGWVGVPVSDFFDQP